MMPAIRDSLLAVSHSLPASILAKATIAVALGLVAACMARRRPAAVRHALLTATLGVLLLLPTGAALLPPLPIGMPVGADQSSSTLPVGLAGIDASASTSTFRAVAHAPGGVSQPSKLTVPDLFLLGWIAGGVICLLPVFAGLWQIHSLRRSGLPWRGGEPLVKRLSAGAGIH